MQAPSVALCVSYEGVRSLTDRAPDPFVSDAAQNAGIPLAFAEIEYIMYTDAGAA